MTACSIVLVCIRACCDACSAKSERRSGVQSTVGRQRAAGHTSCVEARTCSTTKSSRLPLLIHHTSTAWNSHPLLSGLPFGLDFNPMPTDKPVEIPPPENPHTNRTPKSCIPTPCVFSLGAFLCCTRNRVIVCVFSNDREDKCP